MLSKRTQLCVNVMVMVASARHGSPLTTQFLSEKLAVSVSNLEGVLRSLRLGDLISAIRGPGGGYVLAKPSDQISIWDVVVSVEDTPLTDLDNASEAFSLTAAIERNYFETFKNYLSSRRIKEFVKTEDSAYLSRPVVSGFRLGPMPLALRPVAPNSVFQLSTFMATATA